MSSSTCYLFKTAMMNLRRLFGRRLFPIFYLLFKPVEPNWKNKIKCATITMPTILGIYMRLRHAHAVRRIVFFTYRYKYFLHAPYGAQKLWIKKQQ